jgi:uncharacterized membrane protein
MSTPNPYAAPKAPVADEALALPGNFTPGGRPRPAGQGWRWIAEGWRMFMKAPGIWIAIVVVMLVISFAANFIPLAGPLALTLVTPVFMAGLMLGCRALDEGRELEFRHLFAGFQAQLGSLIAVGAIYLGLIFAIMLVVGVITGASILAMASGGGAHDPALVGGAFLTVLLAILVGAALFVPVAMLLWFAPALVVLNGVPPVEAMKQSFTGSMRNLVPFLIYGVVLFVFAIVATLPFMLGWLALGPVMAASIYTSYRDIYLS